MTTASDCYNISAVITPALSWNAHSLPLFDDSAQRNVRNSRMKKIY